MTISKLTLRQKDLRPTKGTASSFESVNLPHPGSEAAIEFREDAEPSQLVTLNIEVGAETHRIHIHLPTAQFKRTTIAWFKV